MVMRKLRFVMSPSGPMLLPLNICTVAADAVSDPDS
jgi:hypothetical protein